MFDLPYSLLTERGDRLPLPYLLPTPIQPVGDQVSSGRREAWYHQLKNLVRR